MFKISDNLHFSFSNYTNFKCTYFFANEITFAILGTHVWPLSVRLIVDLSRQLHPYFVYARIDSSGESSHMRE